MPIRWFAKRRIADINPSTQEFGDRLSIQVLIADNILKTVSTPGIRAVTLSEDPSRVLIDLPTLSDWNERQASEARRSETQHELAKAGLSISEDRVDPPVWVDFAPDPSYALSGALPNYIGRGVARHMGFRFNLNTCDRLDRHENHAEYEGLEFRIERFDSGDLLNLVIARI